MLSKLASHISTPSIKCRLRAVVELLALNAYMLYGGVFPTGIRTVRPD